MRIERVVVDVSPLIVLFKSGLAGLLPGLFTEIIAPRGADRALPDCAGQTLGVPMRPARAA